MRTNVPNHPTPVFTHEGGPAKHITPIKSLRRLTLSALLFEDTFYEKGSEQAKMITALVPLCQPAEVAALAVECRTRMYLRHMPLFLVRELARTKGNGALVADTLATVIERPDELAEYLALYWKDGKVPVSSGSKRGLARAFTKFNAETLAKYDRPDAIKLRDVLRLVHAKPERPETLLLHQAPHKQFEFKTTVPPQVHDVVRHTVGQGAEWGQLIAGTLPSPDTWEVALSAGGNKKEVFERLLRERKLGGLAFLRNLRNMTGAKVDDALIRDRFNGGFNKVLPFRFVSALRYAPQYVREMDGAMTRALKDLPKLAGTTGVLVDVSGSMGAVLSSKSEVTRMDVAAGLGVLISGIADRARVFTFSNGLKEVPPSPTLALVDVIKNSQPNSGTYLGKACETVKQAVPGLDRLIVITDEQSEDRVPDPSWTHSYMINVAANKNGVGYGPWTHIDGWSERVIDFIREYELTETE